MSFMGEINDIGVADLLYLLALRRQTGKLSISANGDEVSLFLKRGQLVVVTSTNMSLRLGRMLVRLGYLDAERLREALQFQEQIGRGRPLGRILLDRRFVTETDLTKCVEEQCIEILARVISADQGIFVYNRGSTVPPTIEIVPLNADRIVLEATRRTDELVTLRGLLPNQSAPLMLGSDIERFAETLNDTEIYVASVLNAGASSLAEIAHRLPLDELSLWRTIVSMRERGLLVVGSAEAAYAGGAAG